MRAAPTPNILIAPATCDTCSTRAAPHRHRVRRLRRPKTIESHHRRSARVTHRLPESSSRGEAHERPPWIFRQPQCRRKIVSSSARQDADHNVVRFQSIAANSIHHRLHGSVSAHRKNQSHSVRNGRANPRFHFRGAARNNKLSRHLHPLKRIANPSQIARGTSGAGSRIHEHNSFCFAEEL